MPDGDALRVVAHLASPLAGDAPHLDALLVYVASRLHGKDAVPGYKVDRSLPCPQTDHLPIAMLRTRIGGWNVPRCTSPILEPPTSDYVEYVAKRIAVEHSGLLAENERKVVTTTNEWTKSYRLPLRVRTVKRVVWLCVGNRRGMLNYLKYVPSIGKKIAHGYGRVEQWEIERLGDVPHDRWPWWIDSEAGPVLMRPLPEVDGLPEFLGAKMDYGACVDPYWHRDRYGRIVVPC
jgi:hypothetical protein